MDSQSNFFTVITVEEFRNLPIATGLKFNHPLQEMAKYLIGVDTPKFWKIEEWNLCGFWCTPGPPSPVKGRSFKVVDSQQFSQQSLIRKLRLGSGIVVLKIIGSWPIPLKALHWKTVMSIL